MIEVFKWEWRYCRKSVWKQLLVQACYPTATFLIYYFHKEWLFQMASVVLSLPEEVYAFVGLNHSVSTGNIRFYILFGVMLLQIWIVWNACWRTLQLLQADERTGSICSICNQWYSRNQLGMGKLICSLVAFLIQNILWYGIVLLFTFLGSTNGEQRMMAIGVVLMLWFKSSLVTGMLIVLTFCVGVFLRNPVREGTTWVNAFLLGSLLVGNLYKVCDLLQWLLQQIGMDSIGILKDLKWLEHGYWLSPLSWMNPYSEISNTVVIIQLFFCVVVWRLGVWHGVKGYCKRRIV